ncbi:hypothetical protein SKC41_27940 [Mycobacterium sp. 050128]|uniref:hypothetical protein n=1 Tax=Mycobacterium sp. 050128 TaxID=3096112 RepID=UPI002EDA351D
MSGCSPPDNNFGHAEKRAGTNPVAALRSNGRAPAAGIGTVTCSQASASSPSAGVGSQPTTRRSRPRSLATEHNTSHTDVPS